MFRNILLCTDGSPGADVATHTAAWLAARLKAHLRALHVIDIRLLEGPWLADLSGAVGAQPYAGLVPQLKEIQIAKAATILAAAQSRCQEHGIECECVSESGSLLHTILEHERRADLVVLGQRGEHAPWHADVLGSSVERIVRVSVRPCLVAAESVREFRHVLLAYDGSEESTKALKMGLQLAATLGARATLMTASLTGEDEDGTRHLRRGQAIAADHHVTVESRLVPGNAESAILALADEVDADLIVMGAYGQTRIREWILGSTTSQVLRQSTRPVLLARSSA